MRRAIVLAVVGLFMGSSAAFAEGGCDWSAAKSASAGTPDHTVATDAATPKTPTTKDTKG